MNIITISVPSVLSLHISINNCILAIVMAFGLLSIVFYCWKKRKSFKTMRVSEAEIGIGNNSIKIIWDKSVQAVAYKIWVELNTRKIAICFDENNDVILEVYNSWYAAFSTIRQLLRDIPPESISSAEGLIELTTKVLNEGLRPHLTKWQARYKLWYERELKRVDDDISPQEIQKRFPDYSEIINEIKETNRIMMNYSEELKKIAFDQ